MNVIENLSRMLARVPPLVFTILGGAALVVLLVWMASRRLGGVHRGSRASGRLWEAQDLYDTAVRYRSCGDRMRALACLKQSLAIYEEIGVDGEERAMIERAIRDLGDEDARSPGEED
jgi:hypothetical protein